MCGHLGVHNKNESWKERTNLTLDQKSLKLSQCRTLFVRDSELGVTLKSIYQDM